MPILPISLQGSIFSVGSNAAPTGLSIAGQPNGNIVIAWQDGAQADADFFQNNGGVIASGTSGPNQTMTNANVVPLADGGYVVTFNDNTTSNNQSYVTVTGLLYDSNFTLVNSFTVIPKFQQNLGFTGADVFATPDGGFAYAESENQLEYVQSFHADGTTNGNLVQTGSQFPYLYGATALTNGNYVTLTGNFDSFWIYTPSGTQVVGPTFIAGGNAEEGDITSLPNGRFVITYIRQVNSGFGVFAQIYNSDGTPFGGEIAVNNNAQNPVSSPGNPHIAAMPDGRFIVSWYDTSGDAGNNLTEARVFNPNGTPASNVFAIPNSAEGSGQLNDVTALGDASFAVDWNTGSGISGQRLSIPLPEEDKYDFTGTSQGDILIQGASTAQILYADMVNGTFQHWVSVVTTPGWGVVGSGMISGGPDADVVIENGSNQIEYANLVNGQFANWVPVGQVPGFAVVGVGDVNGDLYDDIIIQNQSTGEIAWGNMAGGTLQGWTSIGSVPGWTVGGVADLNYGGGGDIVIQNQSTGQIAYANMAGGTFHGWVSIASTPGWKLVGAGNVAGPGQDADIVIQNQSTGQIMYGNMQNGALQNWVNVGTEPGWNVTSVEDITGNAYADIVIQNPSTGQIAYADMTGGTFQQWVGVASAPGFVAHSEPGGMSASFSPLDQAMPAGAPAPSLFANNGLLSAAPYGGSA